MVTLVAPYTLYSTTCIVVQHRPNRRPNGSILTGDNVHGNTLLLHTQISLCHL